MWEYKAELVKVVDGDTIDVRIDLGFKIYMRTRLRLYGINTPESRTRDLNEKNLGLAAKYMLKEYLTDKLHIKVMEKDKYGRYLALVKPELGLYTANDYLMNIGLAKPYFGGARGGWCES